MIYQVFNSLLYPFILPPALVWADRRRDYPLKIWKRISPEIEKKYTYFFHLASLGEAKTVSPLLELWKEKREEILFETVTPTGYDELRKKNVDVILFPFDYYPLLRLNLRRSGVKEVFVFETELWPGLFSAALDLNLRIRMLNVKFSSSTISMLRRTAFFWKRRLRKVDEWFVVDEGVRNFLVEYGIEPGKIKIVPDLKYLSSFEEKSVPEEIEEKLRAWVGNRRKKIIVMGSMHRGEEVIVEKVNFKKFRVIYVPRHLNYLDELKHYFSERGLRVSLFSDTAEKDSDILLVDKYGLLSFLYNAGDIAVIGGSFVPHGGHNPLEAVNFKKPVIFGRHMENFKEIAGDIVECGGGSFCDMEEIGELFENYEKFFPPDKIRSCYERLKKKSEIVRDAYSLIVMGTN